MQTANIKILDSPELIAEQFAEFLKEEVNHHSSYHVALSGGTTPKLLFDVLASKPEGWLNWDGVHLYWGDERCVPPNDEESNYRMTKEHLLDKIDLPDHQIHRIHGEDNPEQEAIRYGEEIEVWVPMKNGWPRFDMVILGMGADGHTASIFPDQMELLTSDKICEVATHPQSGQKRVTLTGKAINAASKVAFLVTGDTKKEKVASILKHQDHWEQYPAGHIRPQEGTLYWFLDEAAAATYQK